MSASKPTQSSIFVVKLNTFDKSRVVIKEPKFIEYKNGNKTHYSEVKYLDDKGQEKDFIFQGPKKTVFFNCLKDIVDYVDQVTVKGEQMIYNLTTLQTVTNPTPDEQYMLDMIQALWELNVEFLIKNSGHVNMPSACKKKGIQSLVKANTPSDSEEWLDYVKFPASKPKNKDKKEEIDESKPYSMFIPCASEKKYHKVLDENGKPMVDPKTKKDIFRVEIINKSNFYDATRINPVTRKRELIPHSQIKGKKAEMDPYFRIAKINWGGNPKNDLVSSTKFEFVQGSDVKILSQDGVVDEDLGGEVEVQGGDEDITEGL